MTPGEAACDEAIGKGVPGQAETSPLRQTPSATADWVRALERSARLGAEPNRTLPRVVAEMATVQGSRPALIGEQHRLSYAELAARQNRYARWALDNGLAHDDTVGLLMGNCPDYLAIWLGLTQLGITVALLNTNLVGAALAHCLDVAGCKLVIVAADLAPRIAGARPHLSSMPAILVHGNADDDFSTTVEALSGAPLDGGHEVTLADRALLIFTSGTTGLPKAANVSHHRLMSWSTWFAGLMDTRPDDRMYDCLPLYHSIGGVVATGSLLVSGGSVVIRERFSASRFWADIVEQDCTLFQYIGELCRYLVGAPPGPHDRTHRLRLCAGNGLRGDVWSAFQARFAIPRVLEFYAATEGTVSLYNVEGKVGAVGRVPSFMAHRSPAAIVRLGSETGEPLRDESGLCQRVTRGETGELLGRLATGDAASAQRFEGYTDVRDSSRKLLQNVFAPGDRWLRTGDLMRQDAKGYFFFVDRVGDTFRWKGENVATTEVAEILSGAPGVLDVTVYGVAVPGMEGRAGMAALVVADSFDLPGFRTFAAARLPAYARPVFLRFQAALAVTETFKQKKAVLAAEGYDPAAIADALFIDDPVGERYRAIDAVVLRTLQEGKLRL